MFDMSNTDSDCVEGETCGTSIAPLYFISFIVICSFIMLNLFILIIIQQFDQYYLATDNVITKFEKDLVVFKNSWTEFSKPNKCIKMKDNKLVPFFKHLSRPLGMNKEDMKENSDIHKNIVQMDIRADEEGYIYFNELLYKVMKNTYGIKHIRNKRLAEKEAATFIKINRIQEKNSKFLISEEKKAIAVNPFLAIMYYKISFKTWINFAKKRYEKQARDDNILGSEHSNEDLSDSEEDQNDECEHSEYSYKTFEAESVGSSSAHLDSGRGSSFDSGIGTIIENTVEENEKENLDASDENMKGKRLFVDEEDDDEQDEYEEDKSNNDEVQSDRENDERSSSRRIAGIGSLEKRKSSAPENVPVHTPRLDFDQEKQDLNIIEEKGDEHTISNDGRDI